MEAQANTTTGVLLGSVCTTTSPAWNRKLACAYYQSAWTVCHFMLTANLSKQNISEMCFMHEEHTIYRERERDKARETFMTWHQGRSLWQAVQTKQRHLVASGYSAFTTAVLKWSRVFTGVHFDPESVELQRQFCKRSYTVSKISPPTVFNSRACKPKVQYLPFFGQCIDIKPSHWCV